MVLFCCDHRQEGYHEFFSENRIPGAPDATRNSKDSEETGVAVLKAPFDYSEKNTRAAERL